MATTRIVVEENWEIRAPIEVVDPQFGTVRDAVFFNAAEYNKMTPAERQKRLDDRKALLQARIAQDKEDAKRPPVEETAPEEG